MYHFARVSMQKTTELLPMLVSNPIDVNTKYARAKVGIFPMVSIPVVNTSMQDEEDDSWDYDAHVVLPKWK